MISRIRGTLLTRELDRVEVMTPGGVGYDIAIPRTVYERLPRQGEEVSLHTYQLVREDALIGTGAFRLKSYTPNRRAELVRFPLKHFKNAEIIGLRSTYGHLEI